MNFSITLEIDQNAYHRSLQINKLSKGLNSFFKKKDYGEDLLNLYIGLICVKTRLGYEEWFKIRKPRFKSLQILKNITIDDSNIEIRNAFSYDLKIDYEEYDKFTSATEEESLKILAKMILISLENLDKLPKKVKDVVRKKFESDIEHYFFKKQLI